VDREELGPPAVYGKDRIFAYIRLESSPDKQQDEKIAALEAAGHPVVRIGLQDIYDLGQEFFRWEIATAVAGAIIGINAFNQPDVEASKIATRELTSEYEKNGSLPPEKPRFEGDGVKLFTDDRNSSELQKAVGNDKTLVSWLRAHLGRISEGDYFGLLAYVQMNEAHERTFGVVKAAQARGDFQVLADRKRRALRVHLGPSVQAGLDKLVRAVTEALS
jgi:transaldolase/glucose-6-phosphate isomerase